MTRAPKNDKGRSSSRPPRWRQLVRVLLRLSAAVGCAVRRWEIGRMCSRKLYSVCPLGERDTAFGRLRQQLGPSRTRGVWRRAVGRLLAKPHTDADELRLSCRVSQACGKAWSKQQDRDTPASSARRCSVSSATHPAPCPCPASFLCSHPSGDAGCHVVRQSDCERTSWGTAPVQGQNPLIYDTVPSTPGPLVQWRRTRHRARRDARRDAS